MLRPATASGTASGAAAPSGRARPRARRSSRGPIAHPSGAFPPRPSLGGRLGCRTARRHCGKPRNRRTRSGAGEEPPVACRVGIGRGSGLRLLERGVSTGRACARTCASSRKACAASCACRWSVAVRATRRGEGGRPTSSVPVGRRLREPASGPRRRPDRRQRRWNGRAPQRSAGPGSPMAQAVCPGSDRSASQPPLRSISSRYDRRVHMDTGQRFRLKAG